MLVAARIPSNVPYWRLDLKLGRATDLRPCKAAVAACCNSSERRNDRQQGSRDRSLVLERAFAARSCYRGLMGRRMYWSRRTDSHPSR